MISESRLETASQMEELRIRISEKRDTYKFVLTACSGTGCRASDSRSVWTELQKAVEEQGFADTVELRQTGCHGFCEQGPLLIIEPGNILYCKVKPSHAALIVSETIGKGQVVEELLYTDPESGNKIVKE